MAPKSTEANATVVRYEALVGCLYRVWVRPDWALGEAEWHAGQFVRLAIPGDDVKDARAYSFVDARDGVFEFYVVAVTGGRTSPRLQALRAGDRLWVEEKIAGHFVLEHNPPGARLLMVATGAGVAPFVCMLRNGAASLAAYAGIGLVHQVRSPEHLVYGAEIAAWAQRDERVRYVPVISQPTAPLHVVDGHAALTGHVQDHVASGRLARQLDGPIDASLVVMLCGNPAMIKDMTAALEAVGLARHKKSKAGQIITERYW